MIKLYSEEGLEQFKADLPAYEEEYQAELRAKAEAEAEAKKLGLPGDISLWHRSGATNAGKAWVIGPDGMERECDFVDTMMCGSNSKRYHQSYEGDHVWNQILPGELVLYWSHAYTAAPHEFEVIYCPEALTGAQLERVAGILRGLFHHEEPVIVEDDEEGSDEQPEPDQPSGLSRRPLRRPLQEA